MEIIVSNIFLDKLTEFRKKAFSLEDDNKILLSSKITRFLNSNINIVTNITEDEVDRCFTSNLGIKEYKTIKDSIIHKLIKNGYDYDEMNDISDIDCKSFLFTDNTCYSNVDNGIIEVNFDKEKSEFYLNSTLTQRTFKNEYEEIRQLIPICNSMLYIDPYIIEGNESDRKIKNENFIKLIHSFIKHDLNVKFQLTIITRLGQWNHKAKKLDIVPIQNIKDLVYSLEKINNLEFEIYLTDKLYFGMDSQDRFRDRNYYTNYTKGSFGHPNDGKTTYFNQNFMAISTDINKDYDDYLRELKLWSNFIKKIPDTKFNAKTKYGNLTGGNRLFESL